jgi:chromosome segregation ATPase
MDLGADFGASRSGTTGFGSSGLGIGGLSNIGAAAVAGGESRDLVLLKCREVIEQLHAEVEEEREKRRRLEKRQHQWESDHLSVTTELEIQKQKRQDAEADTERLQHLVQDLERQIAEVDRARELQLSSTSVHQREASAAKAEISRKEIQIQELTNEKQRLEAKVHTAQMEARQLTEEVTQLSTRLGETESERARLRISLDTQVDALQRDLRRTVEEKDAVVLNLQRQLQEREREVAHATRELQRVLAESQKTEEGLRSTIREQDLHQREEYSSETARLRAELDSSRRRAQEKESAADSTQAALAATQAEAWLPS